MALNPKQRRFVDEYLIDQHVTNAAKRAGYSARSAHSQGSDLLKKPEIAALVEKGLGLQRAKAVRRAERAGLSKERWLAEMRAIATSNIDDLVTVKTDEHGQGKRKYYTQDVLVKDTADRPRRLGRAIKKITPGKHGVSVEMHSKEGALEKLGRHYGWLTNDVNLNLPDSGVKVEITLPSNGREAPPKPEGEPDGET